MVDFLNLIAKFINQTPEFLAALFGTSNIFQEHRLTNQAVDVRINTIEALPTFAVTIDHVLQSANITGVNPAAFEKLAGLGRERDVTNVAYDLPRQAEELILVENSFLTISCGFLPLVFNNFLPAGICYIIYFFAINIEVVDIQFDAF